MDNFLLILVYLGIGLALRRVAGMPKNTSVALNAYALNVALPAVILSNVPLLTFSSALLIPTVTPWLLMLLVIPLIILLGRLLHWPREVVGAMLIVLPLGNTSYLGFPLVQSFFGSAGMPYAMVYDQLGSFLALASYAVVIAALYSPKVEKPAARDIVLRIVSFPPFLALIAGLALRGESIAPLAEQVIATLAATLIPLVMIAVGFQISIRLARSERVTIGVALGIKMLLMPLCTFLLWAAFGQRGLASQVAVFQAAMPPMISAATIAIMAGLAPRLVTALIGIGIVISLVTLPALYWLLSLNG
ncbi:MAG: AEC family transporter [Haliea sp.]|nr:AEC family transporter [Haliea sp.]